MNQGYDPSNLDAGLRACEVGEVENGNFEAADECERSDRADEYLSLVEEWFDNRRAIKPVGQAGRWTYFLVGMEQCWIAARIGGFPYGWVEVISEEIHSTRDEAAADVATWCRQEGIVLHEAVKATTATDNAATS